MEKPQKLASEIELKVSDADNHVKVSSVSDPAGESNDSSKSAGPGHSRELLPSSSAIALAAARSADALERKRLEEQAFLKAYNKRQIHNRIKLGGIFVSLFLLIVLYFQGLSTKGTAIGAFNSTFAAFLASLLGNRDGVNATITQMPVNGPNTADLVSVRSKIVESSIDSLERDGRVAVQSRLGLQRLLMQHGEREKGLHFGDVLIQKYPDLPSNYKERGDADFYTHQYNSALESYRRFLALSAKGGKKIVVSNFANPMLEPVFSAINSGKFSLAREMMAQSDWHDSRWAKTTTVVHANLDFVDMMDARRARLLPVWTAADDAAIKSFVNAGRHALYEPEQDAYPNFVFAIADGDYQTARQLVHQFPQYFRESRKQNIANYRGAILAIAENNPQACLDFCSLVTEDPELLIAKARAYNALKRPHEAILAVDKALSLERSYGYSNRLYTTMMTEKSSALVQMNRYDEALKICDDILKENPLAVNARAVRYDIFKRQGNSTESAAELEKIASQLKEFESFSGNPIQ